MKHNCWTCQHLDRDQVCEQIPYEAVDGDEVPQAVIHWTEGPGRAVSNGMPAQDSDGCPGWDAKEGA